ncbi:MAG: nickel-dependent lactate racemase [Succiniclasticum sp.]|jgi:nickel-dependent lactate racemase|nr:nickel-dependent lactate racemase [Succiniclasticum sp.]MEE3478596.1 nickel-dependent lactate racemase [Succiniclasticum sp.]
MKVYEVPYGKGSQQVLLPEEKVSQVLLPPVTEHPRTVEDLMRDALDHPIGSPKLDEIVRAGDKVVLVVSDITRTWAMFDKFVPILVAELNKIGVPDDDISVIIATGKHRLNTAAEKEEILGKDLYRRLKVYDHDPAKEACVYYGTTKRGTPVWIDKRAAAADKVILTGGLSPHIYAGFGGGRKSVLPGIAAAESINHNHNMALTDEVGGGVNPDTSIMRHEGNRVSEDMCDVAALFRPDFLVNVIVDAGGNFYKIVAGDWYKAWYQGTKDVMKLQGVATKQKSDVVIVSGGGYPHDISLYQGMKCYAPGAAALKEGGILIAVLRCQDMEEPPEFFDSFRYTDMLEMEKAVRADFTVPFYVAFYMCCLARSFTIILVTEPENFAAAKKTGVIPAATLEEAWKLAQEKLAEQGKQDYTINIMPYGGDTLPILG